MCVRPRVCVCDCPSACLRVCECACLCMSLFVHLSVCVNDIQYIPLVSRWRSIPSPDTALVPGRGTRIASTVLRSRWFNFRPSKLLCRLSLHVFVSFFAIVDCSLPLGKMSGV